MNDKYYTPKEVSKICGVSILTIYRWIRTGKLPVKTLGSHYKKYILESDIPTFMREGKNEEI
jgi:excisionase family DNA binding protein